MNLQTPRYAKAPPGDGALTKTNRQKHHSSRKLPPFGKQLMTRLRQGRLDSKHVKDAARNQWLGILSALGVTLPERPHLHNLCPGCGGRDRFRFDDKGGDGTFICGQGGNPIAGDGFSLLQHVHGWEFNETLQAVADYLRIEPEKGDYKPRRLRYEGVDWRDVEGVLWAVMVLEIVQGDLKAGRPKMHDTDEQAKKAKATLNNFINNGGTLHE